MRTRNRWTACICAALLLNAAPLVRAQQPRATPPTAGGTPAEGIGVSGYWKIDVRNPDGSLASHTEFENALTADGQLTLVNALLGANAYSSMAIVLSGSPQPCMGTLVNVTAPLPCFINGASLSSAPQTSPSGALLLTGSTTALNNGVISSVSTLSRVICGSGPVVGCGTLSGDYTFTAFALGGPGSSVPPIPVTTGQIIQVSVTLSFS